MSSTDAGHTGEAGTLPRPAALVALAFILYGAGTLAFWAYGGLSGAWRSPLLAGLALPCAALALLTGGLLRGRSRLARPALIGWALALLALNAGRMASEGTPPASALVLGACVGGALVFVLHRYMGRVCDWPGEGDAPLVASRRSGGGG